MVTRSHARASRPGPHPRPDRSTEERLAADLWQTLRDALGERWADGWMPLDLSRCVDRHPATARRFGRLPGNLLDDLIADDLAGYARATVDPRILDQLATLDAHRWWPATHGPLRARATRLTHDGASPSQAWQQVLAAAAHLLDLLRAMPPLHPICPPPGQAPPPGATGEADVDQRVLEKVRLLLAKAESTPYEAEAETFTAGAQAMMARHSIDAARLAARAPSTGTGPRTTRIHVFAPYEQPKMRLLAAIGHANRCRTVWHEDLGCASVVGFPADLLAVEALFTSLLVQGTTAMQRHGSRTDHAGRSRTRAFRSSFLTSYALRIGERLATVTESETTKARAETGGQDLLPALAARDDEVDAAFAEQFPSVARSSGRISADPDGWHAGRAAADRADLARGGRLPR